MEVYPFKLGDIPCPVLEPGLPRNTGNKDANFFGSLAGKQRQVSQGNDVIPFGALAFG
jgi:hypothetical protein